MEAARRGLDWPPPGRYRYRRGRWRFTTGHGLGDHSTREVDAVSGAVRLLYPLWRVDDNRWVMPGTEAVSIMAGAALQPSPATEAMDLVTVLAIAHAEIDRLGWPWWEPVYHSLAHRRWHLRSTPPHSRNGGWVMEIEARTGEVLAATTIRPR